MGKEAFKVKISPVEVYNMLKAELNADLIHEEMHSLDNNHHLGTLIFEKYFFRVKNRAALIVLTDNLHDDTEVRVISTASSEGMFFNFDWGASSNFINSVKNILSNFIIET